MSRLTAELLGRTDKTRRAAKWQATFQIIADRVVEVYGLPTLGNFDDPVEEVFYIMLSARTTDAQYRKTHTALRSRFPNLATLAVARVEDILPCISGGGLANKRSAHVKKLAACFVALGDDPAGQIRRMTARNAFDFLNGLPGMGPKSAFCVMAFSLGYDVFPVDTNVQRVATRLGALSGGLKHYQAQQRLPPLVPPGRSKELHTGLVVLGRTVCLPRKPRCGGCPIAACCRTGKLAARRMQKEGTTALRVLSK